MLLSNETLAFALTVINELLELQKNYDSMCNNIDEIVQKNLMLLLVVQCEINNSMKEA